MGKESAYTLMVQLTKEIGTMARDMEKEPFLARMATNIQVIGCKTNQMEKVMKQLVTRQRSILTSSMESQMGLEGILIRDVVYSMLITKKIS